jgi:hypothetical protein
MSHGLSMTIPGIGCIPMTAILQTCILSKLKSRQP